MPSAGDLKNADVKASFGFDTACKVFSEMIGNIMIDAMSAKKYYHFIRQGLQKGVSGYVGSRAVAGGLGSRFLASNPTTQVLCS